MKTTYRKILTEYFQDCTKDSWDKVEDCNLPSVELDIEFIQDYTLDYHPEIKPLLLYTEQYIYISSFVDGFIDIDFFPRNPNKYFEYQFHIGNFDEYKASINLICGTMGVDPKQKRIELTKCKTR